MINRISVLNRAFHRVGTALFVSGAVGMLGAGGALSTAGAQVVPVGNKPFVGSSNPVSAEPPVSRPSTTPCLVTLFNNEAFNDYSAHPLSYAPPAGCAGPWAKVVLTIDFTVTAGRQYDRTASLYLGNANIFFGTTAEPRSTLSPSWHVERDVTDLSAIFNSSQSGQAIIYNIYNSTYNGGIYGTAQLAFYPADLANPAPVVAAVVVPVSGVNSPFELDTTASQLTTTFTAPRNTEKAYLDVISQSQQGDEFWYLGAPNDVAGELETSGNTAFRETEVAIDGKPAGVAPVYPWIYTGGIDPYLWEPITGVQTLNFKPYRVDLTPFAGVLSDGAPHTVSLSVFNANGYFDTTANLLLYTDPLKAVTGGGLLENTLTAAPTPNVVENLTTNSSGAIVGTVTVESMRDFRIRGYVNTALGRVETTVAQKVNFNSTQTFDVGTNEIQNAVQTSTVASKTTEKNGVLETVTEAHYSFPLTLDYSFLANPDGTYSQIVSSDQQYVSKGTTTLNGFETAFQNATEQVSSQDTLVYNSTETAVTSVGPTASSASYVSKDSSGNCYKMNLASVNRVLTEASGKTGCPKQ